MCILHPILHNTYPYIGGLCIMDKHHILQNACPDTGGACIIRPIMPDYTLHNRTLGWHVSLDPHHHTTQFISIYWRGIYQETHTSSYTMRIQIMYKENHIPFSHVAYSDTRGDASVMTSTPPSYTLHIHVREAHVSWDPQPQLTHLHIQILEGHVSRESRPSYTLHIQRLGAESSDNGLIDWNKDTKPPCNYLYHSFCSRSKCQYCPCKQMLNSLHYILHRAINSMSLQYYMWELVKHTFNHGH